MKLEKVMRLHVYEAFMSNREKCVRDCLNVNKKVPDCVIRHPLGGINAINDPSMILRTNGLPRLLY